MEYTNYGVKKYLQLLSKRYKNIQEVSEEIINLQAIMNLPKGTEVFVSDVHGEYELFSHILNNGSGIIKSKIEDVLGNTIEESERKTLATLIYYPEEKLAIMKKKIDNLDDWYSIILHRLIEVTIQVCSKYTRSKVRKALPDGFDYIIDELLNVPTHGKDKDKYYNAIIKSIIELDRADEFIVAISDLIKKMAIDHLHIVGDLFDRGPKAKLILDDLMKYHSLDIQWGNHDAEWMGAAAGNDACICNVVRICSRYDNLDTLEEGYGINIRPLSTFAMDMYKDDPCTKFMPKMFEYSKYSSSDKNIIAKIHKAITVMQFKLEGQLVKRHPEYNMEDRLLLDKVNYKDATVTINGNIYTLNDKNFPTIDPKNPYELTKEESEVMERLHDSFLNSETLHTHISFVYAKGNVYKKFNSNLLFHGCIPMEEDGSFRTVRIFDKPLKGKAYLDYIEMIMHKAFFDEEDTPEKESAKDFLWYLWCGADSPLFGKDKAATFERYLVNEKEPQEEIKDAYFKLVEDEKNCNKIFEEFGLDPAESHIINGHIPVKEAKGESPIRANGKLLVIDGGFAKSYREQTGKAGYTLTYNSYGLILGANEPFDSKQKAIEDELDVQSKIVVKEQEVVRKTVADTDVGERLKAEAADLKMLLTAYKEGLIKETFDN